MRNCTRLFYYVWHWDHNTIRRMDMRSGAYYPLNKRLKSKKAALRLLKRCPFDGFGFGQIDCRGVYKGKRIAYCCAYWNNGKIIEQEIP